ncbi:HCT [Linum grandiflorum]
MIVNIIKSSIVFPLEKTKPPRRRLWLSNLDLLHGRVHVPVLCMYKLQENHHFLDAKLLKEALSKVLALFYPMAGRLGRDDNGRLEIDCNGQGVLFREADSDFQLSQVAESMPSSELLKLVPTVDYSQHFSSYPLLLLQVTRFKCGGAILGIGIHHSLADGESTISFINTWSNMVHGLPPTIVPFLDRTLLQASNPPSPKFHHIEYDSPPSLINNPIRPKPTSKSIFKFTPRQLNALRAKANPSNNNDSGSRSRYSTYQILTAHIWRCVSRARGLPDDQPTRLHISVDGRARLNPPVPSGYFGNTLERIQEAIKRMDDEYLRSAIDYLENPKDPTGVMQVPGTCKSPNLKIISWIQLPFHRADFGLGSPVLIRPMNPSEGKGHLLPMSADGSISLIICLEEDAMMEFQKLVHNAAAASCL